MKNYVLDTNVQVFYPHALLSFDERNAYITNTALEEPDHLKNRPGDFGTNASAAIRLIDETGKSVDSMDGASLTNGGKLYPPFNPRPDNGKIPDAWDKNPDKASAIFPIPKSCSIRGLLPTRLICGSALSPIPGYS